MEVEEPGLPALYDMKLINRIYGMMDICTMKDWLNYKMGIF